MQAHTEGSVLLAMQIGFNARNAVVACDMAAEGIAAPREFLEGEFGYFALIEESHDLAAAVASTTGHLGQPPPDRPFHGHVTVARYRGKAPEDYAPQFQADFAATEIALVRSHPPGTYTTVATFPLS